MRNEWTCKALIAGLPHVMIYSSTSSNHYDIVSLSTMRNGCDGGRHSSDSKWITEKRCATIHCRWGTSASFCGVLTESSGLLLGLVAQLIGGGEFMLPRNWDSKRALLLCKQGWVYNTNHFGCLSNIEGWTEGRQGPLFLFKWKMLGIKKTNKWDQVIWILHKKVWGLACGYM